MYIYDNMSLNFS